MGSFQSLPCWPGDGGSSLVWPSGKSHLGEAFLLDLILPLIKPALLNYQMFQACRKIQKKKMKTPINTQLFLSCPSSSWHIVEILLTPRSKSLCSLFVLMHTSVSIHSIIDLFVLRLSLNGTLWYESGKTCCLSPSLDLCVA